MIPRTAERKRFARILSCDRGGRLNSGIVYCEQGVHVRHIQARTRVAHERRAEKAKGVAGLVAGVVIWCAYPLICPPRLVQVDIDHAPQADVQLFLLIGSS